MSFKELIQEAVRIKSTQYRRRTSPACRIGRRTTGAAIPPCPIHLFSRKQQSKKGPTMFRRLTFKTKLMLAFSLLSLFLIAVGVLNYAALMMVSAKYDHVAQVNLEDTMTLSEMTSAAFDMRTQMNKFGNAATTPEDVAK